MEPCGLQYEAETKTVLLQGCPVTVTSRTPIFTPEQRNRRRSEIEAQLYNVAKKYTHSD